LKVTVFWDNAPCSLVVALREELENRVLRRTFGSIRDEVKRELGKLLNEKLHILYSCPYY
jgi:hypothetical protein